MIWRYSYRISNLRKVYFVPAVTQVHVNGLFMIVVASFINVSTLLFTESLLRRAACHCAAGIFPGSGIVASTSMFKRLSMHSSYWSTLFFIYYFTTTNGSSVMPALGKTDEGQIVDLEKWSIRCICNGESAWSPHHAWRRSSSLPDFFETVDHHDHLLHLKRKSSGIFWDDWQAYHKLMRQECHMELSYLYEHQSFKVW